MRCAACGAHNPEQADWCTQCYQPLSPPVGESEHDREQTVDDIPIDTEVPPEPEEPVVEEAAEAAERSVEVDALVSEHDSRFRRTAAGLDWQCQLCETWNPIERTTCMSCGTAFARTVADEPPPRGAKEDAPETAAILLTALMPGVGHVLLGRMATGVARAVLYIVWLAGGLLLLREAASNEQSLLPALPLLGGAFLLWLFSTVDVLNIVRGSGQEILRPRLFLWLAIGVIGLVMLSFLSSATRLPGVGG